MKEKKTQTTEQIETLAFNKEECSNLKDILRDYIGMVEYTYKQNLAIVTAWEKALREEQDKNKTLELVKGLNQYKKNAEMLDLARMRADQLKQKVDVFIPDEENETTATEWTWEVQDGTTDNEPETKVSEDAEVLHETKE